MDENVLVDVDLWILGAAEERFEEYEGQVREEYGWVPGPIYRRKRRAILESFVSRPTIYSTGRFIERYERQARANLARSIARL
jgi:predicted metal-dependent HD superfamily phosphohydrolase